MSKQLSGFSHPFGIMFFGEYHTCWVFQKIRLDWKGLHIGEDYEIKVRERKYKINPFYILIAFFVLVDVISILSTVFQTEEIAVSYLSQPENSGKATLLLILEILFYVIVIVKFRRTRSWHGAEHKAIMATEHNDLMNASKYTRIHPRCGTNLMPFYIVFLAITGLIYVPLVGCSFLFTVLTMKKVPRANNVSVKIGGFLQRFTTKESSDFQMRIAKEGMERLMEAEANYSRNGV